MSSAHESNTNSSSRTTTPVFLKAENHVNSLAVVDQNGAHPYSDLIKLANRLCDKISDVCEPKCDSDNLEGARIAFLCSNNSSYVVCQWAIWMSGGVCVPLSKNHPPPELQYFIEDSGSSLVVTTEEFAGKLAPVIERLGIKNIALQKEDYVLGGQDMLSDNMAALQERRNRRYNRQNQFLGDDGYRDLPALMMYTSGTTGRPKGVVHTHGSLQAQIDDMTETWGWTSSDVVLHVLPLHHIHGIVNILMTALNSGATCVMMPAFDPSKVWSMMLSPAKHTSLPKPVNMFMAVPTIYAKLIKDHETRLSGGEITNADTIKAACISKIRLMVSGSAALPQPIMDRWKELTGHTLLERYGMTETGMVLTNPLKGPRLPGTVGKPFPQLEVCIARQNSEAECGHEVLAQGTRLKTIVNPGCDGEQGQLYVRGPNIFTGYWNKPQATQDAFTKDGWFKTGDTVCFENGVYKIMGRTSVDIIKCGGYKLSALDIERHLLAHPDITDVAVLGLPDLTWGEKVASIIVLQSGVKMTLDELRDWAKDVLATYQLPTVLRVLDVMPRNAMGKINKKDLLKTVFVNKS